MSKINNWKKEHLRIKRKTIRQINRSVYSFIGQHQQNKKNTIKQIRQIQKRYHQQHLRYKKETEKLLDKKLRKFSKWWSKNKSALLISTIGIGMLLIVFGSLSIFYRKTILSFQVSPTVITEADLRSAEPKSIKFEKLDLEVSIMPAKIEDGIWQTSETHATHLSSSMRPGENGNIVIYGHNKKDIFASLKQVSKGQIIQLTNQDGDRYDYQVTDIQVVNPDQIELVMPTEDEQLTVYTCTGWFDSQRLVVKALPL